MSKIYMSGIGGIGMSALAQYYLAHGHAVLGSDRSHSRTTALLEEKGVHISYIQDGSAVPRDIDFLVYSDALMSDHPERLVAEEHGIKEYSYFKALGEVTKGTRTIAVAGTHGKTTTTAMLAKILVDCGIDPSVIVGSLVSDFKSNYRQGKEDVFVVEACEYRNHLLELSPEMLVITNIEWDHTDWFKSEQDILDLFRKACEKVPAHGTIVIDMSAPHTKEVLQRARAKVVDFAGEEVPELQVPGEFNRMNARAAQVASRAFVPALDSACALHALASFKGTWRRFEYKGTTKKGALVYDDYAHHPTAVSKTIQAVKELFPNKKLVLAFHPHLFSRTKDLFQEFATCFAGVDELLIAPIYSAREIDDGSMSNAVLADEVRKHGVNATALNFDEIEALFRQKDDSTVIMTMGAGNIYTIADTITTL